MAQIRNELIQRGRFEGVDVVNEGMQLRLTFISANSSTEVLISPREAASMKAALGAALKVSKTTSHSGEQADLGGE